AQRRAHDRGAESDARARGPPSGDPGRGDRPRRPRRTGGTLGRAPRARPRRARQFPRARLATVAGMTEGIRVLVVDDDALVRAGLTMLLAGAADIEIVAEVADGSEVAGAVAEHAPDVVLMDIRMPGMDGLTATERLRAQPDAPQVIVLTTFEADDYVLR